ncbi:hypothetical protein PF008_g20770 [Phytophthora fragariae]|uniref:Uncharacterized protein n=1 Tax=Phytophthora fragariae TaxID=53985 RepID=A0A6G0QZQ2_9STRA|nr:hypothetical protein PF008_g20770 [Phytophthora fragariae]
MNSRPSNTTRHARLLRWNGIIDCVVRVGASNEPAVSVHLCAQIDSYQKMSPALRMLTLIHLALDAIDPMSKSTETEHRGYSSKSGTALSACAVMTSPSTRTNGII